MKKVLAITCLLVLCIGSIAMASEVDWRFQVKVDDGTNNKAATAMQIGAKPAALDGVDTVTPLQDSVAAIAQDATTALRWAVGVIPGDANTYTKDIYSPAAPSTYKNPDGVKRWEIRVTAGSSATGGMRVQFMTMATSILPPTSIGGVPVSYKLTLFDNQDNGVAQGGFAEGTVWNIVFPTTANAAALSLTLPLVKVSAYTHEYMKTQSYGFYLDAIQPVPEPGGLMALGTGIAGLAGFAYRRRRA